MSATVVGSPAPVAAGLPPALRSALGRVRAVVPTEGADAEAALRTAMIPLARSRWPEVAWSFSTLTGTGFPVELAWASRDTAVRWTCEVGGPEVAEPQRLVRAGRAVATLGGGDLDLGPWALLQQGRPLRWGAWLGLRHRGRDRSGKVYLELPPGASLPAAHAEAARQVAHAVPGLAWRMAGVNADGTVELYARVPALTLAGVSAVGGLVADGGRLAAAVSALLHPARQPPHPSGVSVVLAAGGEPIAVTWFGFAKAVWSSDARVAAAMGRLGSAGLVACAPGSLDLHRALAAGPDDGRWRHGMVGVGVDLGGGSWLQAGLRPT